MSFQVGDTGTSPDHRPTCTRDTTHGTPREIPNGLPTIVASRDNANSAPFHRAPSEAFSGTSRTVPKFCRLAGLSWTRKQDVPEPEMRPRLLSSRNPERRDNIPLS